jgi:hypothetical protein
MHFRQATEHMRIAMGFLEKGNFAGALVEVDKSLSVMRTFLSLVLYLSLNTLAAPYPLLSILHPCLPLTP